MHSPHAFGHPASAEELLLRARALVPGIAERVEETELLRDLPAATVTEIRATGLFRLLQPAAWGGLELDPRIVLDIQNIFAETCVSTAWVYGVLSVQAFVLARFDPRAQADVWRTEPDMLVSSSFQPVGKITLVEGGYRLSGRFTFSSGSSHCGWAILGGIVPPGPGREQPEMRLFLVPRSDYQIDDVWHVIGLKGTGSNDIVVDDAFVPTHRSYQPDSGMLILSASSGLPPLYRLPWLYLFTSMISNLGVGAGRGALKSFSETTRTRTVGFANAPAQENAAFLSAIGRTMSEIDMLDLVTKRNLARLIEHVDIEVEVPLGEMLLYRSQLTGSMRRIAAMVDELMVLLGGRGLRADAPLARIWLDLNAARAHAGNDPATTLEQLGREALAVADQ